VVEVPARVSASGIEPIEVPALPRQVRGLIEALGAYQATLAADRTEILVTGVDGQAFAIAEVATGGNWIATVRQDWGTIATTELGLIEAYFAGEEPAETIVYVPAVVFTAENACS